MEALSEIEPSRESNFEMVRTSTTFWMDFSGEKTTSGSSLLSNSVYFGTAKTRKARSFAACYLTGRK